MLRYFVFFSVEAGFVDFLRGVKVAVMAIEILLGSALVLGAMNLSAAYPACSIGRSPAPPNQGRA